MQSNKRAGVAAFELKFLLNESQALEVQSRLSPLMTIDPHAARGNEYHITTRYCDTGELDVFHRRGRHKHCKFRLRRYDAAPIIFLERKARRGQEVRKRRTTVDLERVAQLVPGAGPLGDDAEWYRRQLARNRVSPVCLIEYQRAAYFAAGVEGPARLTFYRNIVGGNARGWSFERTGEPRPLLADKVVCEFKFRGPMPLLFKSVVQEMRLAACGVSKYRQCIQASGIATEMSSERNKINA